MIYNYLNNDGTIKFDFSSANEAKLGLITLKNSLQTTSDHLEIFNKSTGKTVDSIRENYRNLIELENKLYILVEKTISVLAITEEDFKYKDLLLSEFLSKNYPKDKKDKKK